MLNRGFNKDEIELMGLKQYNGIENDYRCYTFLGYVVVKDENDQKIDIVTGESYSQEPEKITYDNLISLNIGDISAFKVDINRVFKRNLRKYNSVSHIEKVLQEIETSDCRGIFCPNIVNRNKKAKIIVKK